MEPVKDPSRAERRTRHAERPGFHISEYRISPSQRVPWHYHNQNEDTFYVLEGRIRLSLRDPEEELTLEPGETYTVSPPRPHLVTNGGDTAATFFILQRFGEFDFVPLT